jgi:broad specificity phosphatase PhoE
MKVRRLTMVRHGETTGQSSVRYYGATDVPLSALGEAQMRDAGAALAGEVFDAVYSSRLQRSQRGAMLVSGGRQRPTPLAAFDEVDYVVCTAGSFDLLAELVCEDDEHLLELINKRIRALPGVRSTESFVYLKLRKQTYTWGTR